MSVNYWVLQTEWTTSDSGVDRVVVE